MRGFFPKLSSDNSVAFCQQSITNKPFPIEVTHQQSCLEKIDTVM